jgi:hypothetical protein
VGTGFFKLKVNYLCYLDYIEFKQLIFYFL